MFQFQLIQMSLKKVLDITNQILILKDYEFYRFIELLEVSKKTEIGRAHV